MEMAASMVVMVLDPDDPKRGEINVVNDARAAAQMVESFLEAGYEQNRVRVFSASPLEMRVVQKPVVSFVAADGAGTDLPSETHSVDVDTANAEPTSAAAG